MKPTEARIEFKNIHFARAIRDGGIHASAALNHALAQALESLSVDHGLSNDQLRDVKRVFGDVMADIFVRMIDPAFRAFPELEPTHANWIEAVVEQTKQVGQMAAVSLENASTDPLFKSLKR